MAEKKNYCGSGKKQSATWLKITINPDKIADYIQEYKGNRFVKLDVNIYDKPNEYGKDVSVTIDAYKKEEPVQETEEDVPFVQSEPELPSTNDDLPF